jgi:hypothetical protein
MLPVLIIQQPLFSGPDNGLRLHENISTGIAPYFFTGSFATGFLDAAVQKA